VQAGAKSAASVQALREAGFEAQACDILEPASLAPLLAGCNAVINIATSLPKPGGRGDWTLNDRIRTEGTRNLIAACIEASVPRLVVQSVAMLLCADDSRPQTEDDPIVGYGRVATAAELERLVQAAPLDWRIARGGLFYGAGREQGWQAALDDAAFRIPAGGTVWLSQVHVRDYAGALAHIVELDVPRQLYNACDDQPLAELDLYREVAQWRGKPVPPVGDAPGAYGMRSFRVSNAKLRASGWTPQYPTLREGLQSFA
jgi:nucleoside-diphosphate-sugar epimerase